ncbi:MAG: 1,3-beta-glucanase [Marmoricola sp.]|nr:1,3-beta-glucanase [Marmoricola sp.]
MAVLAAGPASCGFRSGESNAAAPMKLVWSDEFNGWKGTQPNPKYWNYETGGKGFGNNELQCYTTVPGNISTDGIGRLIITARYQPGHRCVDGATNDYTSARITTQKKFTAKYGRLEVRAKVPSGVGTWPAFWALGNDHDTAGWPRSGEIDVMEYVGKSPGTSFGTIHGPTKTGAHVYTGPRTTQSTPLSATFHTWAATWTPTQISWSVDGKTYGTVTKAQWTKNFGIWAFDKPFYLLLNLAIGGNMGGPVSGNPAATQRYLIDYVRVYR